MQVFQNIIPMAPYLIRISDETVSQIIVCSVTKTWNVSLIVVLTVLISSQDKNCILYFTKEDVNSSKKVGNDKNMENILNSQRYLALKKFNDLKKKFFFFARGKWQELFPKYISSSFSSAVSQPLLQVATNEISCWPVLLTEMKY